MLLFCDISDRMILQTYFQPVFYALIHGFGNYNILVFISGVFKRAYAVKKALVFSF